MKGRNFGQLTLTLLFAICITIGLSTSFRVTKDNRFVLSFEKGQTKNEVATITNNEAAGIKTTLVAPQAVAYMLNCLN